jgi:multisubunit Na+/H+ antiporter MnhB subunit
MNILKIIYVLAIAALLTIVVVFGVSAFFQPPERLFLTSYWLERYYEPLLEDYHRNVFSVSYPLGLLFVILGLVLRPRLNLIKPALLLGGIATIIYAMAQSHLANEFRIIGSAALGLVILFYLGYRLSSKRKRGSEEKT